MANIQVLRFETKFELQPQLVKHVAGETRDETAMPKAPPPVDDDGIGLGPIAHLAGVGMAEARRRLEAARPSGGGLRSKDALDPVVAGPPPYYITRKGDDGEVEVILNPDRWTEKREREWAKKVRDLVGTHSAIVTLDLHRDETSPHVQGLVIPIGEDRRLGWCKVRDGASQRFRDPVRKAHKEVVRKVREQREDGEEVADPPPLSTKSRYGVLEDLLYYRVSRGYELERGEVGSKAAHEQINRTKATERRQGLAVDTLQARGDARGGLSAAAGRFSARTARGRREGNTTPTRSPEDRLREDAIRLRDELEAGERGALARRAQKGPELIKERDHAAAARKAAEVERDEAQTKAKAHADAEAAQAERDEARRERDVLNLNPTALIRSRIRRRFCSRGVYSNESPCLCVLHVVAALRLHHDR